MASYVYVFKPSLTNYPDSKIFSLELLLEECSKLIRVVGWNLFAEWLTAKSFLLRCWEFLPLVLYWVLNKPLQILS